ncbi:MAG: RING finger protein [Candidatus Hodarchaeales archaeon]|jgi:hypothetical protein
MSASEKTDKERISFGKIPYLWKKKINNYFQESPDKAIATFFENFLLNNEPKQMVYGLEISLPQSMSHIITFIDNLNLDEFTRILQLFNSSAFLESILRLDTFHHGKLLVKIAEYWPRYNPKIIKNIISQIDPSLSLKIYQMITSESIELVDLFSLWLDQDVRVLYLLLEYYFKDPKDIVVPIFHHTSTDNLIDACKSKNFPIAISASKIDIFLNLFNTSSEEISYLLTGFSNCSEESQKTFIDWLTKKTLPIINVISSIPIKHTANVDLLIISYFMNILSHKKDLDLEILKELINVPLNVLASNFLKELDIQGTKKGIEYLFDLIRILDNELNVPQNFLTNEFQTYINQDRERVISAYFTTNNIILQKILIQGIKSDKIQYWKQLIDLMVTHQYYKRKEQQLQLFSGFEERTKNKISEYLVKNSFLLFFLDLFQDSGFFKPILLTKTPIEPKILILLRNYLQKYIHENFEEITLLGKKITYPKVEIANTLTKNELKKLIVHIEFNKTLLQPWEEIFLSRFEDSLPYLLDQLAVNTKKSKDSVIRLIKKIIDIDYIQFWKYIGRVPEKRMSKYDNVCLFAFEKSIRNLGDLIVILPKGKISYIAKKIIPKFSSEGRRMLYSLLSISDSKLLDNPRMYELITAIVNLDPKNYVYIVLLRISKIISFPGVESFTKQLFNNLITSFTYQVFSEVDSYSLNPLTKLIAVYVTKISDKKFFIILKKLVPNLKTDCLRPILVNQTIHRLRTQTGNFSVLDNLIPNNETQEYSEEGYLFLTEISNRFTGHSTENDIKLFIYLKNLRSPVQKPFLEAYFDRISQSTFEQLLNDPRLELSGRYIGPAITKRFTAHPPANPERYFMALFRQTKRREIKKAVLPLLGEYCSWMNLAFLLELPEQKEYKKEYDDALKRFAQRFNIASSQTLMKIWSSGLKDIYNQTSQSVTMSSIQPKSYQTQCPKCGNPILENQKSCGFCPQRFTCAICFKSVVTTKDTDLVECPQCSNIFHRHHLSSSVKMKPECPICHIQLTLQKVSNLPRFQFFFH